MDDRAAKLALARKKLRDHQEKKLCNVSKEHSETILKPIQHVLSTTIGPQSQEEVSVENNYFKINPPGVPAGIVEVNTSEAVNPSQDNINYTPKINIAEILYSNKRELDQIDNLQNKLFNLEISHAELSNHYKACLQKIANLENELQSVYKNYEKATKDVLMKESEINSFISKISLLSEENSNLLEQLEFTKTVLSAKEAENDSLHSQLYTLQNQYDVVQLKLQQLTNGPSTQLDNNTVDSERNEILLQKITGLEQQVTLLQKERDQINLYYQHFVAELNEQLKSITRRNEELTTEVQCLSNRENSLIEQIGEMEIRIQNYNLIKKETEIPQSSICVNRASDDLKAVQDELNQLRTKHEEVNKLYEESNLKIMQLSEIKPTECKHDDINLSKLNADITSDKIAAQRASEQNKKLKQDLLGLEDAYVKMTKDKLELTEKLTAEKYLNRELTIKLAEIEEKAKDVQSKLKAKDVEMLRLLTNYRNIENKCEELKHLEKDSHQGDEEGSETIPIVSEQTNGTCDHDHHHHTETIEDNTEQNNSRIPMDDAMVKLQERFLKIMGDVADLSDEKHRLEHIILQLQNETDTICEYVALYQQQRSLLKKRDEERSAQLKIFQQECEKLKSQLEELSAILKRFAEDTELSPYFQNESRVKDINKVMDLLSELKNNSLIDPKKKHMDFNNFYPCNCCSGKLIDV